MEDFAIKMQHACSWEEAASSLDEREEGRRRWGEGGRWGMLLKASKVSLDASVLLAGAWDVDVQHPAATPGSRCMKQSPAAAGEKSHHALALVHPTFPMIMGRGKNLPASQEAVGPLGLVNCLKPVLN